MHNIDPFETAKGVLLDFVNNVTMAIEAAVARLRGITWEVIANAMGYASSGLYMGEESQDASRRLLQLADVLRPAKT